MKCVYLMFLLYGIFLPLISTCTQVKFYRKDYNYKPKFDAFYKLHSGVEASWNSAFTTCYDEGAMLFYPNEDNEGTVVRQLADDALINATHIFVGLHNKFNVGELITVDGQSTKSPLQFEGEVNSDFKVRSCALMNVDTGLLSHGPCDSESQMSFVCKKTITLCHCPTVDEEYKYIASSKKCYKVNRRSKTWNEAMRTCQMEGGILTVIENSEEAQIIRSEILNYVDRNNIIMNNYHVGVRKMFNQAFYTVKGQKFADMYENFINRNRQYSYDGDIELIETGNIHTMETENECGGVLIEERQELFTITNPCNSSHPFICEMKAN